MVRWMGNRLLTDHEIRKVIFDFGLEHAGAWASIE